MSQQPTIISGRRRHRKRGRGRVVRAVFETPRTGASAIALPVYGADDAAERRRSWITAAISAALHAGALVLLLVIAALTRVVPDEILPVQLIRDDTPEAAPAPKALAERRSLNYAPAVQSFTPQIVNPQVVAQPAPVLRVEALRMEHVTAVRAPTLVQRSNAAVERVAAVDSRVRVRAASVDVTNSVSPTVRGPVHVAAPVGPSVGPRQVTAAAVSPTAGLAPVRIGGNAGSSSPSGMLSNRDVLGSRAGVRVASVNTTIGDGYLRGSGGEGTGVVDPAVDRTECFRKPEVLSYLHDVKERTVERWVLPPGLDSDQEVTLRFRIDAAGSASRVSFLNASDNALGASAVDALRSAAPFPPMSDPVRCLGQLPIRATFTNPTSG